MIIFNLSDFDFFKFEAVFVSANLLPSLCMNNS